MGSRERQRSELLGAGRSVFAFSSGIHRSIGNGSLHAVTGSPFWVYLRRKQIYGSFVWLSLHHTTLPSSPFFCCSLLTFLKKNPADVHNTHWYNNRMQHSTPLKTHACWKRIWHWSWIFLFLVIPDLAILQAWYILRKPYHRLQVASP